MSTLTVTNIQTANSSVPLTLTTGNTTAGDIIVNNDQVLMFANSTTNVTINSTSIAIAGVSKIGAGTANASGNQITVTQQLFLSGNVTPTKLAANTSAWNPGTGVYNIRAEANSTTVYYSLFGLTAGLNGQEVTITNINATALIIRNEDPTETTSANRFNMPNHIKLDGYMSAQFYYDGTLSRWRLVDSVNIPFDHKYALTKGIYTGGYNLTSNFTTADKITYATEANAAISGANLPIATRAHAATGNADKGFNSGGFTTAATANTFRTTFSTETLATVTGANLSQARYGLRATGNVDKGFFSGGAGTPVVVATADRINYSTETTAPVSGANISQGRENFTAVGTSDKGFYVGGRTPTTVATADRITYSTETNAAVSGSNLSVARVYNSSAGNADKGFVVGGSVPNNTVVDRITYSSETTASTTAFTAAMDGGAGAGNDTKGFFAGGYVAPAVTSASYRLTYSSESSVAVSGANLSQARNELTAF